MKNLIIAAQSVLLLTLAVAWMSAGSRRDGPPTSPAPGLRSDDVVEAQLAALRRSDAAGIADCFNFSSPENRRTIGPVERFAVLVRAPAYAPLLAAADSRIVASESTFTSAHHVVHVIDANGESHLFEWHLARQSEGAFRGCWMTDSVQPLEAPPVPDVRPTAPEWLGV